MPCRFKEFLDSILNWKILDSILNWKILDSSLNWKFSQTSGTVFWDVVVMSCSGCCVCHVQRHTVDQESKTWRRSGLVSPSDKADNLGS